MGVGGSLSTAHPQIHAGGGEGRTLRPVSQQATGTPGWLSRLQGWDAVSPPHWRFGAGVQGVCPFWAPWARWPQRRLEQGLPLSLPPAARPVWAVFRDGRAGPGWAAGASPWVSLPGAPSRLHPPYRPNLPCPSPPRFCFYYKRNIAGAGLSFPPRPRWLPWSGLDANLSAWLTLPPLSSFCPWTPSPVRLLAPSPVWPLRWPPLCGAGVPTPFSRWGVQGPRGKAAGPGSPLGSRSLSQGKGCGPGLHKPGLA